MTSPLPAPAQDDGFGWRAVLGLADPAGPLWPRVRIEQYAEIAGRASIICLIQLLGAAMLGALLWDDSVRSPLAIWAAAVAVMLALTYHAARKARERLHLGSRPGALGRTVLRGLALGVLWMLPPLLFDAADSTSHQLALCLVTVSVMAGCTLTGSAVPLGTLAFLLPSGFGLAAMMLPTGDPLMVALPLLIAAALGIGGLASAHGFVRRKLAEIALEDKREVVSLLLREYEESDADWLWQVDTAKRLANVSSRFARVAGRAVIDLEGLPLLDLVSSAGGAAPALRQLVDRMNAREPIGAVELPIVVDGETRWWSLSATPRHDARGTFIGYRGVGSDITEQRRSSDRIEQMARFDALTGLANRSQVMDQMRRSLAAAVHDRGRCALLLVDLDKFKPVNDTLGHPVGDRLLKLVGERLRGLLEGDDLCGRLGGDEFAIVLPRAADPVRVDRLGQAVIERLTEPFEVDGNIIRIGASVGAAIGPHDGRSIETLLRNADLALYRAKDDGRGLHRRYDPSMLAVATERRAIEVALREAIGNDEFHLLYQPVVDTDSGRIESFEALLRWTHPKLGSLSPARFMPIAAEARVAPQIAAWVLRNACAEAVAWPEPIALSVNISADQLADPQLTTTVLSALAGSGLAPGRLVLEVSESIFLGENRQLVTVLDRLQALGVQIALDDFGTGYAQLAYVKHHRFCAIKIDHRFVRGPAAASRENGAIVRAALALARSLDVPTVAEGAETHEELARMYQLGCRRVQGHLAAAPMPADEVRGLIAATWPQSAPSAAA